jgi:hypothetical protein
MDYFIARAQQGGHKFFERGVGQFASANAEFVSDYENARNIVDTAASHASPNPPTPVSAIPATAKP